MSILKDNIDLDKTIPESLPRHIAIIMDGNGRWAKNRKLPRIAGHKAGVETVRNIVEVCAKKNIEVLTLFAFSSENWRRPEKEVSLLLELFVTALNREIKKLHESNVKLNVIGDRTAFNNRLQKSIKQAEEMTQANDGLNLVIAANYGGRWDITQAARKVSERVLQGEITLDDISPELLDSSLSLSAIADPDLFIRTGGEHRISNYLLWQLAYTELVFTDVLWPDFNEAELQLALNSFASRQRRFGRTGDQVEEQVSGS